MKILIAAILVIWSTTALARVAWYSHEIDGNNFKTCVYQDGRGDFHYRNVRRSRPCPSRIEA